MSERRMIKILQGQVADLTNQVLALDKRLAALEVKKRRKSVSKTVQGK